MTERVSAAVAAWREASAECLGHGERRARDAGDALCDANERLREALRRYGRHEDGCAALEYDPPRVDCVRIVHINRGYGMDFRDGDEEKCTCGLSAALGEG